jgi:hypothetical protein
VPKAKRKSVGGGGSTKNTKITKGGGREGRDQRIAQIGTKEEVQLRRGGLFIFGGMEWDAGDAGCRDPPR